MPSVSAIRIDDQAAAEAMTRHLIGLVSDTFWRVADGVVIPFDGDLDEFVEASLKAGLQVGAKRSDAA